MTLWSNRGEALDGVAPGTYIATVDVMQYNGYNPNWQFCPDVNINYFCNFGGTSAAAPQFAAVAARVLARRPSLIGPGNSAEALYEVMRHSCEDAVHPDDPAGFDESYGWGRLNAARALLAVVRGDADSNESLSLADATLL